MQNQSEIKALLEWQYYMGASEAVGDLPTDWSALLSAAPQPATTASIVPIAPARAAVPSVALNDSLSDVLAEAHQIAKSANSLEELKKAVESFDGCSLKRSARNTVFADGAADSDIMIIGEAPGADEDRQGVPFCGLSGQLLDQMLGSIGLNRAKNCYITNTLFWRPPGNRTPTPEEIEICRPFVERHIELFKPRLIILVGGTAVKALLKETRGITRLRGSEMTYNAPDAPAIPTRIIFHPSYLLRQPLQKRLAWHDLLAIEKWLRDNCVKIS